jgi:molybdate transport system substrate-binding protein
MRKPVIAKSYHQGASMVQNRMLAAAAFAMIAFTSQPQRSCAAELRVIASGAVSGAFREIVPQFEQASGHKLVIVWGPSSGTSPDAIPVRLASGEKPDLVIMVETAFSKLLAEGKFLAGERKAFARSRIGIGVKSGAAKPDIGSVDELRRALLNARSIGYSEGASGVYVAGELMTKLGIADQVLPKTRKITGELVGQAIARGDVEIGLQQISELKAVPGVNYAGPLPEAVQKASVMIAGIALNAKEPDAAKTLINFLTSAGVAYILAKSGLDPMP